MLARPMHLRRSTLALTLVTPLVIGCGAPGPAAPVTVDVAAPTPNVDAVAPEPRPKRVTGPAEATPPAPRIACPETEGKRLPCHLTPKCSGEYGTGRTARERDCNQLVWFGLWTDEAMRDPGELIALGGVMTDIVEANDAAVLKNPILRAAVARYRAALLAEKSDAAALAQAICAGDAAATEALDARFRADLHREVQARIAITHICNYRTR